MIPDLSVFSCFRDSECDSDIMMAAVFSLTGSVAQVFYEKTISPKIFLYVGIGLVLVVLVQALVHFLSDKLQSAAGFLIFADKRMELGNHLRKLPMGYFTSGNLGKINSVLSSDMAFIEEVSMSTIANMMSYVLSTVVLTIFMFVLDYRIGIVSVCAH